MLGIAAVAVVGASIGVALAPSTTAVVGPLQAQVRVVPSLRPDVELQLPPAGQVTFDTHLSPLAVQARISQVDLDSARRLINSPEQLQDLTKTAPGLLGRAALRATAVTTACMLLGAVGLSLLVYRRVWRRTAEVAATVVGALVATLALTAATFDADRLAQPHFTGLLSDAPYVAGNAGTMLERLESYRSGLADIVRSVTALYATSDQLPVLPDESAGDLVTVLHVSDIHLNPLAFDLIDRLVRQFKVNAVIDTGDITTWGTEVESGTLSRISGVGVPYVFVRGNHDSQLTQAAVAKQKGAVVLDNGVTQVAGLVIAGIGDPRFLPDPSTRSGASLLEPLPSTAPSALSSPSGEPTAGAGGLGRTRSPAPGATATTEAPTPGPTSTPGQPGIPGAATPGAEGEGAPPGTAGGQDLGAIAQALETQAGNELADTIRRWDAAHPDRPVQIAAMHEPAGAPPLFGLTPLVLLGHLHQRHVWVDSSGTRVMVEGSTGGAGTTGAGLTSLAQGRPLPLVATLIYIARSGPRAGQVVGYDEVTVGGFGLASISLVRHVVRDGPVTPPAGADPSPADPAQPGATPGAPTVTAAPRP